MGDRPKDTAEPVSIMDPQPYRSRVLRRYCSVHLGDKCEMGERFADTATEVTAEWLDEMATNVDGAVVDAGRFLRGLARELRR